MLTQTMGEVVRAPLKGFHLALADKLALLIALLVAAVAAYFWFLGVISLWGKPLSRFDDAMLTWLVEAELALVVPTWLFCRLTDIAVAAANRWLRAHRSGIRAH